MSVPEFVLRTMDEIGMRFRSRRSETAKTERFIENCPFSELPPNAEGYVWRRTPKLDWEEVRGFYAGLITVIELGDGRSRHWGFNSATVGARFFDLAGTKKDMARVAKVFSKKLTAYSDHTDHTAMANAIARDILNGKGYTKLAESKNPCKEIKLYELVFWFVPEFILV